MASSLPAELVRKVLLHLKVDTSTKSSRDLVKTLGVCRAWRQIGYEVLYTDIFMTEVQLAKFAESWPAGQELTRSLSISISCKDSLPYDSDTAYTASNINEDVLTAIQRIAGIVHGMVRLESFSLVVTPRVSPPRNDAMCAAVHTALPEILQALPGSLKHLEIDAVGGLFRKCSLDQTHYCPLLRERMPSLSSLRLRVRHLCEQLFQKDYIEHPHDQNSRPRDGAMECTILINVLEYDIDFTRWASFLAFCRAKFYAREILPELILAASSAIANGRCQNPQRLSFFAQRRAGGVQCYYSAINELVLAPGVKTLRYPFREIRNKVRVFLRYRGPDGSEGEAWGRLTGLMDIVEGQVWTQTVEGYRLPSVYLKQNSRFDGSVFKRTFLSKEQAGARARGRLFDKEKTEGRQLLRVREIPGLEMRCIQRDRTRREIEKAASFSNQLLDSAETDSESDPEGLCESVELASEDEDEEEDYERAPSTRSGSEIAGEDQSE
ncbi:uncharacterized protein Z520_02897 [Fonsecaea multimorphosa CBS 102226]|uniref:F-box domain-containing protein n=1 Tax=Fonsecaea multimorphosa CBS 102226 TaxID=1442371 RepID=A0A0D2KDM9_9EURO|nr:uncharacterized protein Z520_02897 [Fonsecaea multimorphosa CBS 102226]KIY01345.1 hypothetical protein Z520_02897 [Fonsecaea multimorphosa CBS 102226]OAL28621.1 hypothetical protein AYO22_02815 [Fonsecaea multimorphosa]